MVKVKHSAPQLIAPDVLFGRDVQAQRAEASLGLSSSACMLLVEHDIVNSPSPSGISRLGSTEQAVEKAQAALRPRYMFSDWPDMLSVEIFLRQGGVQFPVTDAKDLGEGFYSVHLNDDSFKYYPRAAELKKRDFELVMFRHDGNLYPILLTYLDRNSWKYFLRLIDDDLSYANSLEQCRLIDILFEAQTRYVPKVGPLSSYFNDVVREDVERIYLMNIEKAQYPHLLSRNLYGYPWFPSVFAPDNAYLIALLKVALPRIGPRHKVLCLGSGAGLDAAVLAMEAGAHVHAVDINPIAVANTKAGAVFTGTEELVKAWVSDGFSRVTERYDYILSNAPIPRDGGVRNVDINVDDPGGEFTRRIFRELPYYLKPGGSLFMMNINNISDFLIPQLEVVSSESVFSRRSEHSIHEVKVI
jgi:hypothetical protein